MKDVLLSSLEDFANDRNKGPEQLIKEWGVEAEGQIVRVAWYFGVVLDRLARLDNSRIDNQIIDDITWLHEQGIKFRFIDRDTVILLYSEEDAAHYKLARL